MRLKDIYAFQDLSIRKINDAAKRIHPKLLSRLSYKDFSNDDFSSDLLKDRYENEVKSLIKSYNTDMKIMCREYLLEFVDDMSIMFGVIGFDLDDGSQLTDEHVSNELFSMDYLPSIEIAPVWENIHSNVMVSYNPVPFWESPPYWVTGDNEKILIESSKTPAHYIDSNRKKFNHRYGLTLVDRTRRDVEMYNTFTYPVLVTPLTPSEERSIPDNLHVAVNRHLILKHVMENIEQCNLKPTTHRATISKDGSVSLQDEGKY